MPGQSADDQIGQQDTEVCIPAQQIQTQVHNAQLLDKSDHSHSNTNQQASFLL